MTTARARELLGSDVQEYSDDQVNQLISTYGAVCDVILDQVVTDIESHKSDGLLKTEGSANNV